MSPWGGRFDGIKQRNMENKNIFDPGMNKKPIITYLEDMGFKPQGTLFSSGDGIYYGRSFSDSCYCSVEFAVLHYTVFVSNGDTVKLFSSTSIEPIKKFVALMIAYNI